MAAEQRDTRGFRPGTIRVAILALGLALGECRAVGAQDPGTDAPGVVASPSPGASHWAGPPPATMAPADRYAGRPGSPGFFGVAIASIFGPSDATPWTPLPLRTLLSEGWDQPWVAEPNDSGDAQQGWIDAADGNFYRLFFFSYAFTNRTGAAPDGHTGAFTLYTPLSRRLELITVIPFITTQPTLGIGKQVFPGQKPPPTPTSTGFGDITVTPRVMLHEADNFTLVAQASIQTPTGYTRTGAGQSILTPGAQFWWNFAEGWVMRGGFGSGVGTNRQAGGTTLLSQLALGKTLTPEDVPLFGDFTLYLSTNVLNNVSYSKTLATLTPGFRTHLGRGFYALGGVEVPVTGRRPFEENAIFWIMKTF